MGLSASNFAFLNENYWQIVDFPTAQNSGEQLSLPLLLRYTKTPLNLVRGYNWLTSMTRTWVCWSGDVRWSAAASLPSASDGPTPWRSRWDSIAARSARPSWPERRSHVWWPKSATGDAALSGRWLAADDSCRPETDPEPARLTTPSSPACNHSE